MIRIDPAAIRAGAFTAIVLCLPVAIVAQLIVDSDANSQSPIVYLLYLLVLLGFATGGFAAAKRTVEAPYSSGALSALAGFLAIQAAGVLVRAIQGETIHFLLIVTNGLLAYGCGVLGAAVEVRQRKLSS